MFSSAFTSLNRLSHVIVNKADFLKILENYRVGTATTEESTILIMHYDAFENEPDVLLAMGERERQTLKEEILQHILKKIDGLTTSGQDNYKTDYS